MLPIVVCIVCIRVRGVGQSFDWGGGVVIGQGVFGGWVIFVRLMVDFVRVTEIFVDVKHSGGQGIGRGVLLVGRYIKAFGYGVIIFVK